MEAYTNGLTNCMVMECGGSTLIIPELAVRHDADPLTSWSRFLLEKLIFSWLFKKSPHLYGI